MIRAAICDDEKYFTDELHRLTQKIFDEKNTDILIADYENGITLTDHANNYDMIFLDVRMNGTDGFKTAELLRRSGFSGCLIFVTVMKNEMYRAFDYEAFDYLVKPLSEKSLRRTIDRYLNRIGDIGKNIVVSRRGEQLIVKTSDILYCEIINRKIYLHLTNRKIIEYYGRIAELENKLNSGFFRSHRSYLVNLKHISSCGSNEIILDSSEKIPVSRSRRNELLNCLINDIEEVIL